ncbi:IPExxxVDY family protein [Kaistella sp. DKR-2]|uniref:IPExxxVDY family protein n=1 Tax=Kaistella soli TaxID=2849654 RepID=UPI001C27EB9F|nr:IPExxxVDY family protein [Kaistella soli]MBU8882610.1 IPExxxVDY family protein [Kaistella soli]
MKTQKILLDIEEQDEEITLGLVRLAKEVADHELFFHINSINSFNFSRISDFIFEGNHFDYFFPRFEAFHTDSKICIHFIANKSSHNIQKKISTELFSGEHETKFLLEHFQDVDYIIKTSEPFDDFSVILLPENIVFKTQNFSLSPHEELYQIIQYYE